MLAARGSQAPASTNAIWCVCVENALLAAMLAGLFGPLVIVPVVVCVMSVSLTSYPQLHRYHPVVIAILATSWLVPALLLPVGTLACIGTTLAIVAIGVFTSALSRSRHAGLQQVERQAWVLGQLLPQSHPASSSGVW